MPELAFEFEFIDYQQDKDLHYKARLMLECVEQNNPEIRISRLSKDWGNSPQKLISYRYAEIQGDSLKVVRFERPITRERKRYNKDPYNSLTTDSGVYVVYRHSDGAYKIGCAENLARRMKELACACGIYLEIAIFFPCDMKQASTIESRLHQFFCLRRLIGEWFVLSEEQVHKIRDLLHTNQGERININHADSKIY